MARPRSVDPTIVSTSFSYTPAQVPANGTLDITLTASTDAAIGRLRSNFNVNLWASAALNNGLSICNAACFVSGQLYFRLMNATAVAITSPAITFFLTQQ